MIDALGILLKSSAYEVYRMTTPVNLPSKQWKTKTQARTAFQAILNSYKNGETLSEADSKLVIELIQTYYHTPVNKLGNNGVERVYRDLAPEDVDPTRSTSCFWIEQADGTIINFGADKCLNNIPKP